MGGTYGRRGGAVAGGVAIAPSLSVEESGDGPRVVLVHGLSSNLRIWDAVAADLAADHTVVAYDQRNHGLSGDADDFSYEAVAADLARLAGRGTQAVPSGPVTTRVGRERPGRGGRSVSNGDVVVGHSWGAAVALAFAARYPCRAVVCVDGGAFDLRDIGAPWREVREMLRPPALEGPLDDVLARMRSAADGVPWELAERVARRALTVDAGGHAVRRLPVPKHMRIVEHMWGTRADDLLTRARCPVFCLLASRTPARLGPAEARLERLGIPYARVDSVHDVPLAQPGEIVRAVRLAG